MTSQKLVCKVDLSELKNITRRLYEPRMIISILVLVYSNLLRKTLRYLNLNKFFYYPRSIKKLANSLNKKPLEIEKPNKILFGPFKLKLSNDYCYFQDFPNWNFKYEEHEQFVSLHRWNWLLHAASNKEAKPTFDWGESLVRSWLIEMTVLPSGRVSNTYTVSERISNYCLFMRCTLKDWKKSPNDIAQALIIMAYNVANNIEYHHADLTGNHVVNNARALIFAGHCFDEPQLVKIGREILSDKLPILVLDGFLREGSSHYQFLFTRWLTELTLLASEENDTQTLELLEPYLNPLVKGCNFFLIERDGVQPIMPTFGDISPDCDPFWLIDLPISPLISSSKNNRELYGWARLFEEEEALEVFNTLNSLDTNEKLKVFTKTGWYRLDIYDWTAIWHIDPYMGQTIASHAHRDSGAFVLFKDQKEILIDPGLISYDLDKQSRYGFYGIAHNSIHIDKYPPFLSSRDRLYPDYYRRAIFTTSKLIKIDGEYIFSYKHNGFSRLRNGISDCSRDFIFSKESLEIKDFFNGTGKHQMECRFHLPDENSDIKIECIDGHSSEYFLSSSNEPMGGWRFPSYGVKDPSLTKCFIGNFSLPANFSYKLRLSKS